MGTTIQFGEQTKEELVFVPATLKVIEHVRLQYTCRHCETVTLPKAVELPLSKSKASASLIADIIINKYRFHLPFYRQSKLFASYNIKRHRQVNNWNLLYSDETISLN